MAEMTSLQRMKAVMATNKSSQFMEWTLPLSNGARLTGISCIPPRSPDTPASGKPLLVAIHGATCSAYSYDVSPEYTASIHSYRHDVPLIAFNRPNFLGSSGWLVDHSSDSPPSTGFKAQDGHTFFEEEAHWYHEFIFPAIWKEFALPNKCTSIVTTSHSMSVPITIIASTLYADSQLASKPSYTWAGMVLSGLAVENTSISNSRIAELATNEYSQDQLPFGQDSNIHTKPFYDQDKIELMLGPRGLCDESLRPKIWAQNTPLFIGEAVDLATTWPNSREKYQALVKIPILYGLGKYDWIWKGTAENVSSFCRGFVSSPRVEGAVIEGAAHSIELSPVSEGWWTRVFGWAMEVNTGLRTQPSSFPNYV